MASTAVAINASPSSSSSSPPADAADMPAVAGIASPSSPPPPPPSPVVRGLRPPLFVTPPRQPPSSSSNKTLATAATPPGSPMDVDSPPKPRRAPVVSVLDWDDTLCPSSWLYREGLLAGHGLVDAPVVDPGPSSFGAADHWRWPRRELSAEDRRVLRQTEAHVLDLLQTARHYGPVFIVTAAKLQWVRNTAEAFLPRVLEVLLKSESVHVISAREFFAEQQPPEQHPGTPLAWKCLALEAICTHLRIGSHHPTRAPQTRVHMISVGDSFCERDACRILELKAPTLLQSKTLKLLDQPSALELCEQVKMTQAMYEQICRHHESLDLHVLRHCATLQVIQVGCPSATTPRDLHAATTTMPTTTTTTTNCNSSSRTTTTTAAARPRPNETTTTRSTTALEPSTTVAGPRTTL